LSPSLDIDIASCRTVGAALRAAAAHLTAAGVPDAAVDARHLVAHALGIERARLLLMPEHAIDGSTQGRIAGALARRMAREPVSRIIGMRSFHGLSLELGAETLDPRPDTETVVAVALELVAKIHLAGGSRLRILDLGTGSGAIALALLAALPDAVATATDISPAALAIAQRNAERNGLAGRISFIRSHWLVGIAGSYHVLVANPPYIRSADIAGLEPEVALWEPRAALDGGPDGLEAYRAILGETGRVLAPDGWAVFEVGHDQASDVAALAAGYGLVPAPADWSALRDLGGHTRCVAVATPSSQLRK
jgi:release factor glutamine methyltransferase